MTPQPIKDEVQFEDVEKLDIRVGVIRNVEEVPESRKLLRLTVDFGDHVRNILSGMKTERDDPQALIGVQTLFIVNLKPRRMAGEMSAGMLLDVGYSDGIKPALLIPEHAVPEGCRAG